MKRLALAILVMASTPAYAWEDHHRRPDIQQFNSVTVVPDNSQYVGPNQASSGQFYSRYNEYAIPGYQDCYGC